MVGLSGCLLLGACSLDAEQAGEDESGTSVSSTTVSVDFAVVPSVEGLVSDAEVIFIGTVKGIRTTSEEDGGLLMSYVDIDVLEFLAGEEAVSDPDEIVVSVPDLSTGFDPASTLKAGEQVMIFGEYISSDEAPIAIPKVGLIAPLGGSIGILDVDGTSLQARSLELAVLRTEEFEDIAQAVDSDGAETTFENVRLLLTDVDEVRELVEGRS